MSEQKKNAFDCLLRGSSPKLKKRKNRFVACPSCGSSVLEDIINRHLDVCIQSAEKRKDSPKQPACQKLTTGPEKVAAAATKDVSTETNAFAHMMTQSKRLHQNNSQTFRLNADFTLSWKNMEKGTSDEAVWSATTGLKRDDSKIQLFLSTAIPEQVMPSRLVKRHSRLSVPVLKSILQKSIRRRRPLPAIRVAMELVDRAPGELLRRMPIIILEDSTLHPDLPLLCWLMAAESKGYKVPSELVSKVLQIIYEVSSCPWTDCLDKEDFDSDTSTSQNNLLLRSIEMRASYGGMKCDMQMLKHYGIAWAKRLHDTAPLSAEMRKRLGVQQEQQQFWTTVPDLIHAKAQHAGLQHVLSLMKNGLERLELKDLCLEGIDFHCSDVLCQLMSDKAFVSNSAERLKRDGLLRDGGDMNTQIMATLKTAMWRFSSGVNFRQPLVVGDTTTVTETSNDPLKAFWQDMVSTRAKAYMIQYVKSRLIYN